MASSWEKVSTVGYYIYFLGMDAVMLALLRFTLDYCRIPKARLHSLALIPLGIDVVQYAVNPFTGHCFATEAIGAGGPTTGCCPIWARRSTGWWTTAYWPRCW